MSIYQTIKDNKPLILRVCSKYGASNIRIFGSVARKEATEDSDIDLIVDMDDSRTLFDLGGLWEELNSLFNIRIEVFKEKTLKSHIKEAALKEAIKL